MARWRPTADELAEIIARQRTGGKLVERGKRLVGQAAEDAFSAEMDPKATKRPTLHYDKINVVDPSGCAIPAATGHYPKICPWCKRELP